jgi:hypothetical protein
LQNKEEIGNERMSKGESEEKEERGSREGGNRAGAVGNKEESGE